MRPGGIINCNESSFCDLPQPCRFQLVGFFGAVVPSLGLARFVFGIMDHLGVLLAAANRDGPDHVDEAVQQFNARHREWNALRMAKRRKTHDGFTDRAYIVALMIYDFCNYAAAPAARWLKVHYKRATTEYSLEDLERLVEDWFIMAPMAVIDGLSADPDTVQRQHQYNEARRIMREYQAVLYVGDSNRRLGVAPSTRDVAEYVDELAGNGLLAPGRDPNRARADIGVRKNRLFMQRFRKKWSLKHGKIAARMEMNEVAVTQLAPFLFYPWSGGRGFQPLRTPRRRQRCCPGWVWAQCRPPGTPPCRDSVSSA